MDHCMMCFLIPLVLKHTKSNTEESEQKASEGSRVKEESTVPSSTTPSSSSTESDSFEKACGKMRSQLVNSHSNRAILIQSNLTT